MEANDTIKLPYLDGAESEVVYRPKPHEFAKTLLRYDVISFDIFDTLLLRPFSRPDDLLMILVEKHNYVNFGYIRRQAEREARKLALQRTGSTEITIYDIYEIIEFRTGINKEYGVQVELETELEFCFANPYMMELFKIVQSQGKRIIAISDMYLTKPMLMQLLNKAGYSGFEEVYVSSEHGGSKRDKKLYEIVIKKLGPDTTWMHIGDNLESDKNSARELGINTRYYQGVHESGNPYRADGMSELTGSLYRGIVNTHLHNGTKHYSPHYEYGFIYGGLYILGFCKWIYDYAKQNNIDKILFLSRDGEIYHRVFNYLFNDMDNEYVYWSRIASLRYTVDINRNDF